MTAPTPPTPREQYELRQSAYLAVWAVKEAGAGGRAYPQQPDRFRTCFQRDRDRIIHCSAFRRLDFKTQVFVPHEDDHFRTRLTHTLEVAQIGRDLGRALGLNEDLVEAVALAHDLGHPPFGHGGEAVLDELMADHGGFEHNRQSLRVVDYLEHPYPQFRGLNLTRVVRECLAKHETRYDRPISPEFDLSLRAPLEGQLVDLADEIAYTSADLEDALAAGCIAVEQLGELELWQRAWSRAEAEAPDARPIHKRIRACKAVVSLIGEAVLAETTRRVSSLGIDSPTAARRAGQRGVSMGDGLAPAVEQMQQFLLTNVYLAGASGERDREARRIIGELFAAYVGDPSLLPPRYGARIDEQGTCPVVCDWVAGMTDRFCRAEHARLTGR